MNTLDAPPNIQIYVDKLACAWSNLGGPLVSKSSMLSVLAQGCEQDSLRELATTQNVPGKSNDGFVHIIRHSIPMHTQRQHILLVEIDSIGSARCLEILFNCRGGVLQCIAQSFPQCRQHLMHQQDRHPSKHIVLLGLRVSHRDQSPIQQR